MVTNNFIDITLPDNVDDYMSHQDIYDLFLNQLNQGKLESDPSQFPAVKEIKDYLEKKLSQKDPLRVLDVCCFSGSIAGYLKQQFSNSVTIVGIDLVEEAVEKALDQKRIDEGYAVNLAIKKSSPPFDQVDFAYCLRSGPAFDNRELKIMLQQIGRQLKPNGVLIFQDLVRSKNGNKKEIEEILSDNKKPGIRAIRTIEELSNIFKEAGFSETSRTISKPQNLAHSSSGLFHLQKVA